MFLKTLAFSNFVFENATKSENEYDILFLSEKIKAKKNRSRIKFLKSSTPFLEVNERRCLGTD